MYFSPQAQHVAINPVTWYNRAALKLEFYGCPTLPDRPVHVTNVTTDIEVHAIRQLTISLLIYRNIPLYPTVVSEYSKFEHAIW